jgi:hypothetical protein
MITQKIHCEKQGCENFVEEAFENQGFAGWGHVAGLDARDAEGNFLTITLCPDCLKELLKWLTGPT